MSNGGSHSPKSVDYWKEKYLSLVDDSEEQQAEFDKSLAIYRRSLVRVSLAADGIDSSLDEHLSSLRKLVRNERSASELENVTQSIEGVVRKLDEQRQEGYSSLSDSFASVLDILTKSGVKKTATKKLRHLTKELSKPVENPTHYLELLADYFQSITSLLDENLFSAMQSRLGEEKTGGWNKWFKAGKNRAAGSEEKSEHAATDLALHEEGVEDTTDALADEHHVESEHYNLSMIKERVAGVLLAIIDQLFVPQSLRSKEKKIRTILDQGFDWPEVPVLLSELSVLITGAGSEAQRDFEVFLMSLNERLADIHHFLNTSQNSENMFADQTRLLDERVREEIKTLKTSLSAGIDLKELKGVVASRLESIVSAMDAYRGLNGERRDQVVSQISELSKRMETMEKEALALKEALKNQRTQAMKDGLTNLPNRQAYLEMAAKELARAKRHNLSVSLCVADVDHFKRVNDEYGHLSGDKVLKIIAKGLMKCLRQSDFVARYGGEEFIVLMPETTRTEAVTAMEKVRHAIASIPFHFRNERVQVTMSFGVTQIHKTDSLNAAFARADKALYAAKDLGRNRVECDEDSSPAHS